MYSDNHFEDLAFEPGSTNIGYSSTFDINDYGLSAELFSDPSYQISSTSNNPLLQTIQRNTASSSPRQDYATSHLANRGGSNENDNSASAMSGIGNALLGSPQPSTIKKLKSHLSGIGGIGGYLTSPMGSFRHNNNNNSNASPAYSVLKPTASSSGSNLNNHHSLGSSPLKPNHSSSQQQQDPQCLELHTPLPPMPQPMQGNTHQYMNDNSSSLSSTSMQRLQSAPASVPQASTSTSTGRSLKSKRSNINEISNQSHSATAATFNEMDYGGMRIYGRPIQRSASEDPSNANNNNGNRSNNDRSGNTGEGANAAFLPYPDQLPTVTLGRGVKNSRDVTASTSSYPMSKSESEPIPTPTTSAHTRKAFTNLNKPFIQYVAPNSPAGKSAAARNKKSLTVKTADGQYGTSSTAETGNNNNRGKMIPIKMARQAHEMPLTPPISANMVSPHSHHSTAIITSPQQGSQMQSFQNLSNMQHQVQSGVGQALSPYRHEQQEDDNNNRPYFSPIKNPFEFNTDSSQRGLSNLPPHMPSFEFSLEQFGGQALSDSNQDILDQFNINNGYNGNAIDFSSVLGLPSPHQHQHQDSHSSNNGSNNSNHGLLSPPPHSAASTHSSVFSDDQALLFGIPPPASPYFSSVQDENQQQSIDQALASLLGTQVVPNRDGSTTPQPRLNMQNTYSPSHQQQQMFSPNLQQQQHQHQGQIALGISSPPMSPQHNAMTSPAPSTSWAPYQQQSNMQNLLPNIDPSLQDLDNHQHQNQQDLGMLSPQSAHYGGGGHYSNHHQQIQHNQQHVQANNGRIMSSPRRLRGMQSAPDLNAMYSDASNGFNEAFGITSPSPRKPSLKRGRDDQYGDDNSDEENQHVQQNQYGYTQYGDGSSEQDDEDDEYCPNDDYDRPPPRKRANSIHSGGKIDPNFANNNNNNAVAAVLLPLVNPNPARLRPGPKPKTSLPNLQAAHQGVFQVSPRAPPVPAFPTQYLSAASPNPSNAESSGTTPGGCLSPDPDTGYLKPQGGVSKDMLATFYQVGTGSKQTKKGKPQRMYICSIPGCEKEFPRKSAVESHIQTHLEDKPFACPYDSCGASFVRSHDLTRHVRIHSGSKPFQCICGKGFARGDALTRHRQRGICEGSLVPRRW